MNEIKPKEIWNVTIADLMTHRWCFYPGDDEEYNCFEHVIPDTHTDYSEYVTQLELVEFKFNNGKIHYGMHNGSESFDVIFPDRHLSLWRGIRIPNESEVNEISAYLLSSELQFPVVATTKWSNRKETFNGIKYLNENGTICEAKI